MQSHVSSRAADGIGGFWPVCLKFYVTRLRCDKFSCRDWPRLSASDYSDPRHGSAVLSGIYLAKSALIPGYHNILQYRNILQHEKETGTTLAHLRNVLLDFPQLVGFSYDYVFKRLSPNMR